jgi:hypothetical protein
MRLIYGQIERSAPNLSVIGQPSGSYSGLFGPQKAQTLNVLLATTIGHYTLVSN